MRANTETTGQSAVPPTKLDELVSAVREQDGSGAKFEKLSDDCVKRFLVARDLNVEKTTKMLTNHIEWRAKTRPDLIEREEIRVAVRSGFWTMCRYSLTPEEVRRVNAPGQSAEMDKYEHGCAVLLVRTGRWNPHEYDLATYIKYVCWYMEQSFMPCGQKRAEDRKTEEEREDRFETENLPGQAMAVLDMTGWALWHGRYLKYVRHFTKIQQDHCPERLRKVAVCNAPWIFKASWMIIRPWIDKRTASKITFYNLSNEAEKDEFFCEVVGAQHTSASARKEGRVNEAAKELIHETAKGVLTENLGGRVPNGDYPVPNIPDVANEEGMDFRVELSEGDEEKRERMLTLGRR